MKKQFLYLLLLGLLCSIGNVWSADLTVTLDQIRATPQLAGLVKITVGSNVSTSSGKLSVSSNKTGTFTIASTLSTEYYIKSISFTTNNDPTSFSCTAGGAITKDASKSYSFSPTNGTIYSASFSVQTSGSQCQIGPISVVLTTSSTATVEELKTFSITDNVFSFTSSSSTTQVNVVNKANASASSNYINLSKSSNERSITISTNLGYELKFISFYYYDSSSNPSATASTGTYTASSYTWKPASTATSVDFSFDASSAGIKIWKIYVGYEATVPEAPTFSPADGTVEQEGSITISSIGSTSIKYKWMETIGAPDSWDDYSTSVTVPSVTGTRYLYAKGHNDVGDGEVAYATYNIVAPRTPTTLSFVSPTTTVGVDEGITNVPTLSPAVPGAEFTYESSDVSVATVNASTGEVTGVAVGSATITAHYAGDATYSSSEANYIINVVQSAVDTKFWTSAALLTAVGGSNTNINDTRYIDNLEIKGTATAIQVNTGGNKTIDGETVGGRVRFGKDGSASGNYLHFKVKPNVKITFWGIRASDSAQPNGLALSFGSSFGENEQTYSFDAGDVESMVYYYCGPENTDVYAYSGNSSGSSMMAIKVEPISSEPSYDLVVTAAGWASMYLDYPAVVPTGATAYYASAISEDIVTLSPIEAGEVIPANTGVVVNASANSYTFNYSSAAPESVSGNLLKGRLYAGTTTGAATGGKYYRLTWDGTNASSVGFAYGAESGVAFSIGANQAYLVLSAAQVPTGAPMLRFEIEDENNATNIENLDDIVKTVKFIENGRILILRDGITYDALGRIVK